MSQESTVTQVIPVSAEMLRQLKHYTICHLMNFPDCGAPTEQEIDDDLAAVLRQQAEIISSVSPQMGDARACTPTMQCHAVSQYTTEQYRQMAKALRDDFADYQLSDGRKCSDMLEHAATTLQQYEGKLGRDSMTPKELAKRLKRGERWRPESDVPSQQGARTCSNERHCINCYAEQGDCLGPAPEAIRSQAARVDASAIERLRNALKMFDEHRTTMQSLASSVGDFLREAALFAQPAEHPDDAAVDRFAAAMKEKLAQARAKGRGGWQDKHDCPQQRLSNMLRDHVEKGDPRDVANFCMFLHQRGEAILPRTRTMMELAADPSLREPAQPAERQGAAVTDKQVAAAIKTSPELDALIDTEPKASIAFAAYRLGLTHPAAPVGVPDGMVLVPRERLEYACDLLAERKYGSDARSPGHNARLVIERVLADAVAPSAPQGEG